MGASIDLSALTFGVDQVREFSEMLQLKVIDAPALTEWCTVYTDIINKKEIGFIRPTLGLIGVADAGCSAAANVEGSTAATKKTWDPARISIIKDECYTELDDNFAMFVRKQGTNISDLIGTQYMDYLLSFIPNDVARMIFRKAWFEKKTIANVSAGGTLKNGVDVKYFNTYDGIFEQLAAIMTAHPEQKVTIAENAELTRALQYSTLTNADAYGYFSAIASKASAKLVGQPDRIIIATYDLVTRAAAYLNSINTPTIIERLENGYTVTKIDGVRVLSVPLMSEIIQTYFFNGTVEDAPHRIIYTTLSNLGVGFGSSAGFSDLQVLFNDFTEVNRIKVKDSMDSKVLDDELVLVAM